jgi:adenine deaminase
LARRLNTEAAKAVKYGGLSHEEALKFVTINPAIQLGIDQGVGSLETGKDADFVIWSDNPLSSFAVCEQTWIDGINYFNIVRDKKMRVIQESERNKLIQKVLSSEETGNSKMYGKGKRKPRTEPFTCTEGLVE